MKEIIWQQARLLCIKILFMKQKIFLLLTLVMLCSVAIHAQPIDTLLNDYASNYPREKVYLHFDKPVYAAGETIWFKGYIFSGNYPSGMSYNFYVDMINPANGEVLQRKFYPIAEGTISGNIDLPESFKLPAVVIKAYTPLMLNYDQEFIYSKIIRVVAAGANAPAAQRSLPHILSFLPEGGNFIAGISNNIAFKGTDAYGAPIQFSGEIKDRKGNVVASISPVHDGMGKVSFIPEIDEQYTAIWKDADGNTYSTELPRPSPYGVNLHLLHIAGHIPFRVERSENVPASFKTLNLVAHFNQQVVYKAKIDLSTVASKSGQVPVAAIPSGIVTFSLFDEQWKPVAERIAFVNVEDYQFAANVNVITKDLKKRGYNIVEIEVPEEMSANMSVAVTDAEASSTGAYDDNILTHLLLTGDLKGKIHAPYYYFSDKNTDRQAHLDLVMLTNGWRRYNWEQVLSGTLPPLKIPNQEYLTIKGIQKGGKKTLPDSTQLNLYAVTTGPARDFLTLHSANGAFFERGLFFYDTLEVYYQFNDKKAIPYKAKIDLEVDNYMGPMKVKPEDAWKLIPVPDIASYNRAKMVSEELAKKIRAQDKTQLLDTVSIKGISRKRFEELDRTYTSGYFTGYDGYPLDLTNDPMALNSSNIYQYLMARLPGLYVQYSADSVTLRYRGGQPNVFLDQMLVMPEDLLYIPVIDVAYVKLFRPPFYGGPSKGGSALSDGGVSGALVVYTKRGSDMPVIKEFNNMEKVYLKGYSFPKDFYSPDYSVKDDSHQQLDVRSTLYWNPYVLTDADNRKVSFSFYNNDISEAYRIVLEGITADGKLTRVEKIIR